MKSNYPKWPEEFLPHDDSEYDKGYSRGYNNAINICICVFNEWLKEQKPVVLPWMESSYRRISPSKSATEPKGAVMSEGLELEEWGCGWEHWIDVFSEGKIQWDEKEALKQYIRSLLAAKTEEVLEHYYNAPCSGCPEGHPSFWKTITESEEWKEWSNVAKYDMPECGECGFISKKHWHDFIKFIIARPVVSRLEIEENIEGWLSFGESRLTPDDVKEIAASIHHLLEGRKETT